MKIGLIGCGNMGGGMATQLLGQGRTILCFDPNPETLATVVGAGADGAASARDVAAASDLVILSLPKAEVVRAVIDDIARALHPGSIVLDTSTSEPDTTKALAASLAAQGVAFVDGPVSGGPVAARGGTMTMLLGGDADAIARLRPVLDILTAKTVIVGPSGAGHAAKIANNMLCAANLVLVAEAVRLGQAVGVSPADLLEGVNAGSGRSGVSEVNYPRWILSDSFDSGFTMGLMRKDVRLAIDLAAQSGIRMPAFDAVARQWAESADAIPDSADFNAITTYEASP